MKRFVHRGRWVLLIGLGAAMVVGSTGCTPTSSGGSTAQPAPSASSTSTGSSDVQPSSDLRDEHRVEWSESEQVGDSAIRVHFLMGDPRCYGARAEVRDTAAAIEVTVVEGTLPGAPETCTLVAAEVSLLVTSDTPVGGRPIVQP